ncbi:uncharacterized protein PFL1_06215 [Pseudozyma flocculosa PF-1]|uniref:Related to Acid phosphatase n=2 Tax=Pseudozyma flocculosa TaxID=84751 RepID=A0A5C3FA20_9BASI|nr:uncharacterized protein PFL1_06215 [Pseudozyma flocculosa PF-1]EPQ26280.1 hypothetical protein PFL1_06215 [Pseudozyma flocculosa PF-1]SPO40241.1 related to Acid phosphatase precursor [Pseudozyma flocculosa]
MNYLRLLSLLLALPAASLAAPATHDAAAAAAPASTEYGVSAKGFDGVLTAKRPLNIVMTNDDSWASANIRAFYYALRRAGHKVLMVGPSHNQSGKGGTFELPTSVNLTVAGRGGFVPVGAPYAGRNLTDEGLRYFNGTPAAAASWALDQEAPAFFNAKKGDTTANVDLVVSGPNEGTNLGPFLYTLSGTIGAAYFAVERSVPAIAFSGSNAMRNYDVLDLDDRTDESVRLARLSADFVTALGDATHGDRERIMPLGIGLNVNYPPVGASSNCTSLDFVHTRLTGGAFVDTIAVNATTGLPQYVNYVAKGINQCNNGDCSLAGETLVVADKGACHATASVFATDYDAPTHVIKSLLPALQRGIKKVNKNQKRDF